MASRDLVVLAERVLAGAPIGFPTETVYGVGARFDDPEAVGRIYAAKQRPRSRALIVHVATVDALTELGRDLPDWVVPLAEATWPGPLTLVVPRSERVPPEVTGGGDTVGIRAPRHPVFASLMAALARRGGPVGLAGTSANRHGATPPTTAAAAREQLGTRVAGVLDGGACTVGIESTVLLATTHTPTILRPGAIGAHELRERTGLEVRFDEGHDRPETRDEARWVLASRAALETLAPEEEVGVIARFAAPHADWGEAWKELPADLETFARELYRALRDHERAGRRRIVVQRSSDDKTPLGRAIDARITRRS